MPFPWVAAFLIGVADLALAGFISNSFIFKVMVTEWTECKRLGPTGQLFLSVGLSNICGNVAVLANLMFLCYVPNYGNNLWFQIAAPFISSVMYFRFWLAAWLCVFYCFKIVNSPCSVILWGKQRISWLIPRLLAGTLLISFLLCFSIFAIPRHATRNNRTSLVTNGTQGKEQTDDLRFYKMVYLITGCGCPFLVALLCSLLAIASLGTHLCHMTSRESSLQSSQTIVHMRAIGTLLSLLFLYISWLGTQVLSTSEMLEGELKYILSTPLYFLYAPTQAVILMLANPKLKQAVTHKLQRTQIGIWTEDDQTG